MGNYTEFNEKAEQIAQKSMTKVLCAGKDWKYYVENHPVQSMIFGTVLVYVIKTILIILPH